MVTDPTDPNSFEKRWIGWIGKKKNTGQGGGGGLEMLRPDQRLTLSFFFLTSFEKDSFEKDNY